MPITADALGEIILPDHDGNQVRLGELWREQPVALVWLRHYGWIYCKDHAVQLDRARKDFDAAGVKLVLIGQATPRHAAHFRRRLKLELPVLADERLASYQAIGAKTGGAGDLLGPKVIAKGALTTLRTGMLQTRTIGSSTQLGGAIVVRPDGTIVFEHLADDASDNASPRQLLDAAREAVKH